MNPILLLPAIATLMSMGLTVGSYRNHLRAERRDADLLRFVRRLGLINAVAINAAIGVLLELSLGPRSGTEAVAVLLGLASSGAISTMAFDDSTSN